MADGKAIEANVVPDEGLFIPVDNRNYIPEGVNYLQGYVSPDSGGNDRDKDLIKVRDQAIVQEQRHPSTPVQYGAPEHDTNHEPAVDKSAVVVTTYPLGVATGDIEEPEPLGDPANDDPGAKVPAKDEKKASTPAK